MQKKDLNSTIKPLRDKDKIIQSFLKDKAFNNLIPEREQEIKRVTLLLGELKKTQKSHKERLFEDELKKIKQKRLNRDKKKFALSLQKNRDLDSPPRVL